MIVVHMILLTWSSTGCGEHGYTSVLAYNCVFFLLINTSTLWRTPREETNKQCERPTTKHSVVHHTSQHIPFLVVLLLKSARNQLQEFARVSEENSRTNQTV